MDFNKYVDIPFKPKGRDFDGCDCWGLVHLVLKIEFGIEVPTYTSEYATDLEKNELHCLVLKERTAYRPIVQGRERPGDIVNLRVKGKDMHVGVVVQRNKFLHIMEGIRSSVERLSSLRWRDRIVMIGRHEKLAC